MKNGYETFVRRISSFIKKDRIYTDEIRTIGWGTDAGCYRMQPRVVVRSENEEEISKLLKIAGELKLPVTFRAAGTALSGQSLTDSILIIAGKYWEKYEYNDDDKSITLQPGLIGSRVNAILKPYGRYFGPDPASINSCMVGGIVINNASGMSCGTHANSDKEMLSARIVLADGTILDTGSENSKKKFSVSHPEFVAAIEKIRDEILSDSKLTERIRYKYSIKNVTGLNIHPFVEFHDPYDIIAHLMVGSEGTLGFLSEVKMKTRPVPKYRASAMIYFNNIKTAAESVLALQKENVQVAELLDRRSLLSVNDQTGDTAILVETHAETEEELSDNIKSLTKCLASFETAIPVRFTTDPKEYSRYWAIRSGIFPSVGGLREEGTTCIIEDVAFHIENLPEATMDLSDLLEKHGYKDSCIYGHALAGNFHFIINQSFETADQLKRYEEMIDDVVKLVVGKYDGSLKAEHGTGRNMAPFVKYEWGEQVYDIMKRVKHIFDPGNILNPGVIFNDDSKCHLKNLKLLPTISPVSGADEQTLDAYKRINKCIECGFCEVNCLSCGFSLSSRTRIVINREIQRRKTCGENYLSLAKAYRYLGEETCAGDGLCSMSCPLGINVGDLTHEIRRQTISSFTRSSFEKVADNLASVESALRNVLSLAGGIHTLLGDTIMTASGKLLHFLKFPLWTKSLPHGYRYNGESVRGNGDFKVVYIPSCINQTMGLPKGTPVERSLVDETIDLLEKAGCTVIIPENREELCCGTIWESKGMPDIAERKVRQMEKALLLASNNGEYPILCDQSPCLHRMRKCIKTMKLYEPAEFIWTFLKDRLQWHQQDEPVAVHVTCSMRLMKLDQIIIELAKMCSSNVLVPEGVGCCGFAGDKGFTNPELNKYALRKLRKQVEDANVSIGYSNSRTCEIGLQTNSGVPYVSIVYLVNNATTMK